MVGVHFGEFRFLTDVFHHPVEFVGTNWSAVEPNFIGILPLRILSWILKESIASRIEFGHVKTSKLCIRRSLRVFRTFLPISR